MDQSNCDMPAMRQSVQDSTGADQLDGGMALINREIIITIQRANILAGRSCTNFNTP
jgi:hypothetical protein